jgi:AcrR family transcriptional regulator
MYTMCSTEKTAQQQLKFEQVFQQMLLEGYYDDITISELCRRAGLSRKIFYRLFEKKADVLYSMLDRALLESDCYTPEEPGSHTELYRFLSYWLQKKDLLDAMQKNRTGNLLTDRAIQIAKDQLSSPVRSFGPKEIQGRPEAIVFYLSGIFSTLLIWHEQGFNQSVEDLEKLMLTILTTPAMKSPTEYH